MGRYQKRVSRGSSITDHELAPGACFIKLFTTVNGSVTKEASVFVNECKKEKKDTILIHYEIYNGPKRFMK